MKKIFDLLPLALLFMICALIFYEFVFLGKTALPADTLVGAYFPWLDYKWGYAVGVPVKNGLTSDAFSYFFIIKKMMIDMYSKGVIPLWNSYSLSGTPLLATFHSTVFSPVNLFFLVPKMGWSFYIFFASVAASISMYIFLGNFLKHKWARVAGALVFAFSGPMTTWAEFGTAIWAAASLPLLLHFIRKALIQGKAYQYSLVTLITLFLVFSGHVQLFTYTFAIIPLFIHFVFRHDRLSGYKKLALLIVSLFLGMAMGAIQLLPTKEFFDRSIRSEEKYASSFNYGLSPLKESVRLIAADLFGHPARGNHFSPVSYHEFSSYLGALTIPLIIYLLLSGPLTYTTAFFLILFLGSLFLAFENPLSRLIFSLPIPLLTYSSASRLFFITGFSGGALMAFSLEKLSQGKKDLMKIAASLLYSILFILISIVPVSTLYRNISLKNSLVYLGLLTSFLLATLILRKRRPLLIMVALLLLSLDLGRYFNGYNTFVSNDLVFPETPVITWLKQQERPFRIARENTALLPPNTWAYYGLESVEGYDPLYSTDYAHFFHVLNGKDYTNAVSRYALLETVNKKFLDATNVRYFLTITPKPDESESGTLFSVKKNGFVEVYRDGRVSVFENPSVMPRAFFVDGVVHADSTDDAFKKISLPTFDPTSEAVVGDFPDTKFTLSGNVVSSITDHDGSVKISLQAKNEGFLLISDSFDPGWKAKIDGNPVKVYRTDASLMGLHIPTGDHQIELSYLPDSFIRGSIITLCATIAALLLYFILKYRQAHEVD